MDRACVLVDAYAVGARLGPVLRERGHRLVHVLSSPRAERYLRSGFRAEDFEAQLVHTGDSNATVEALRRFPVACVIAATETAVELADALAETLGLPGNGTRLSPARRDKFLMGEAVRRHGLRVARQLRSGSLDEILAWADAEKLERVVIKPLSSAGGDGVFLCNDTGEVADALETLLGREHKLLHINTEVLAQEVLVGPEYVLNAVSCRGRHYFTDLWRYRKGELGGRAFVYDRKSLLAHEGATQEKLRAYASGVLDALGIAYGPSHIEIILTREGPVLVECGARLGGMVDPAINDECAGVGPLELTADAYLAPERFDERTAAPYSLRKHCRVLYLRSSRTGRVAALPGVRDITSIPSCLYVVTRYRVGDSLPVTHDFFTLVGHAVLVDEDEEALEAACEHIRGLEAEGGLYALEPPAPVRRRDEPAVPLDDDARAHELRRRFLPRAIYYQSAEYASVMEGIGWRVWQVAGASLFVRRCGEVMFAKMQRPLRIDVAGIARVRDELKIDELVLEPAAAAVLVEDGREVPLGFDPTDPKPWVERMRGLGFELSNERYAHTKSLVLDVALPEADILQGFAQDRRRDIRLALRSGVRWETRLFAEVDAETEREVIAMRAAWSAKKKLPSLGDPFLAEVRRAFAQNGRCLLARHEGKLVATVDVLVHDGVGYFYQTFRDPDREELLLGAGSVWKSIEVARAAGCALLDLGAGFDERYPDERVAWKGFSFFKERFRPVAVYHPPALVYVGR